MNATRWLTAWVRALWKALFRRRSMDRRFNREFEAYVDELVAERVAAGCPKAEARRQVRLEQGGREQVLEAVRDVRAGRWFRDLAGEVPAALRKARRRPGFSAVVVITLAVGIGSATAVFSVFRPVMLAAFPYPHFERIVNIWGTVPERPSTIPLSLNDLEALQAQASGVSLLGAYHTGLSVTVEAGDGAVRVPGHSVTPDYFEILGVRPQLGRLFTPEENGHRSSRGVVLLGNSVWRDHFGSDPDVVGRAVQLNGRSYTVVGVAEPRPDPSRVDLWLPLAETIRDSDHRRTLVVLGRLAAGVSLDGFRRELELISGRLQEQDPGAYNNLALTAKAYRDVWVQRFYAPLGVLLAGALLVALVAASNVGALLIIQSAGRRRELALRRSLGASPARLMRQLLVEGLVLFVIAGGAGLLLAYWVLPVLLALTPVSLPAFVSPLVDLRAALFAISLSALLGLVFSLGPAVASTGRLRSVARVRAAIGDRSTSRLRSALVVAQVGVCLVVVVGAALVGQSLQRLARTPTGFRTDGILSVEVDLPAHRYADSAERRAAGAGFRRAFEGLPGVETVLLWGSFPPGKGFEYIATVQEGRTVEGMFDSVTARRLYVSPGAVTRMGLRVVAGRDLGLEDTGNAPSAVVISESMAESMWPGESPVGRRFYDYNRPGPLHTVVGVVADSFMERRTATEGLASLRRDVFFSMPQHPRQRFSILLLTRPGAPELISAVRSAARQAYPDVPLFNVGLLSERVRDEERPLRLTALLSGVFAAVASGLALLGLYGVLSFGVVQRRAEIGIRTALGAGAADVARLVGGQAAGFLAAGLALGLVLALAGSRLLEGVLYNVPAIQPQTLAAAAAALAVAGALASLLPTRQALRVDPLKALRDD